MKHPRPHPSVRWLNVFLLGLASLALATLPAAWAEPAEPAAVEAEEPESEEAKEAKEAKEAVKAQPQAEDEADAEGADAEDDDEADDAPDEDEAQARSSCLSLFGAQRHRRRNKRRRERVLESVDPQMGNVIDVTHSGRWFRPYYMELSGIELLESHGGSVDEAFIEIDDEDLGLDCEPGLYKVEKDDSLGRGVRVLDVLDDVVLLEFKGDLAYMLTPHATPPTWRMIWRSPWRIIKRRSIGATKGGKSKARRKRRKRRRRRKRRKRRRRRRRR